MSRPRHRIHPKLLAILHDRQMTVGGLAALAGTGRAHATQVLAGVPGRGYRTRRKLAAHLTATELALLGWEADGQLKNALRVERSKSEFSQTERPGPASATPL